MYCLNMIVRNEADRIERALKSAVQVVSSYVILDTGSTDDTKDRIKQFFDGAKVPGAIYDGEFVNFGQARNDALTYARTHIAEYNPKFFLLMDADMELVVKDRDQFMALRDGAAYEMYQQAGAVHYTNARLLNTSAMGGYKGPTHEYLDVPSAGRISSDIAYFNDYADGSNRTEKFKRDIVLLEKALEEEPRNERYMYYLASSYRDAGDHVNAARWFHKRIEAGGWDEEVWQAQISYAHALKELGDENGFVANLLAAYNRRPHRAEPMFDLAKWYREQDKKQPAALACAEAVEHLTKPNDVLFVNDYVYTVGIKEEISIAAAYVPGKGMKGLRATDELSMSTTKYWTARACARANHYWYMRPLVEFCPSFKWRNIPFVPPDDLVPMNPSVAFYRGRVIVNVRAVNYRIDNDGRYIIKATDGTANAENPIDTRNFIIDLGYDPMRNGVGMSNVAECYRPGNMPCEFNLVTGFEDVRLITWGGELWSSATVRQLAADGQCEQVLSQIIPSDGEVPAIAPHGYVHWDMKRMLREPRETEKNWSPIQSVSSNQHFMWRPGIVVDSDGKKIVDTPPPIMTDNISGSSQLIPWGSSKWLAITHTAHPLPNEPYKRYYHHRFVEYGSKFNVTRMSLPFVFNDRVIEFCAGMCWSSNAPRDQLVISYGYRDCEARIGTIEASEVDALLEQGHQL